VAMWTLPGTFAGSGADGIDLALPLLGEKEHPIVRVGILSLGIAGRGSCDERALAALAPFLSHGNGAVRNAANLAVGLLCQRSGRADVRTLLQRTNIDDRRGPSTGYPLAVGLAYQGSGDESVATDIMKLCDLGRRRLGRYAATAVGLIYQGTSSPRAAELLVPYMESNGIAEVGFAGEALQFVDFDEKTLESAPETALLRPHGLSDGPGAAWMFVWKHFLATPPKPE
jgi:hypothetical protein